MKMKLLSHSTVFRWFTEFRRGRKSVLDEEHARRPFSAVALENMSAKQNMSINDNHQRIHR